MSHVEVQMCMILTNILVICEVPTHHCDSTLPLFSITRCTMLHPDPSGAAPKWKSSTACVCTDTLRRMECRVAMA